MFCERCGKKVSLGTAVCPYCGMPTGQSAFVSAIPVGNNGYTVEMKSKKGINTSVVIGIIIAVAIVLVSSIATFTFLTYGKQQAVIAQMEAQAEQAKQSALEAEKTQTDASAQNQQGSSNGVANANVSTKSHNDQSGEYLWPTDSKYITNSDLNGFDRDTVAAIRNEIFARHGYVFQTDRWINYFNNKSWYVKDPSCTESTVSSRLNAVERANLDTIVNYERNKGWK